MCVTPMEERAFWTRAFNFLSQKMHCEEDLWRLSIYLFNFDLDKVYLPVKLREEADGTTISEVCKKLFERFYDEKMLSDVGFCLKPYVIPLVIRRALKNFGNDRLQQFVKVRMNNYLKPMPTPPPPPPHPIVLAC